MDVDLICSYKSFETDRLILQPTSTEDAPFILAILNTPKWLQYIGDRNVNTLAEAEEYIKKKMLPQLKRLGYSNYTVIRKADFKKMGTCGLYDREGLEGVDIGFAFLPAYEKKGYAFEAAEELKNKAYSLFKIKELHGITMQENISSQRLLEKLGFSYKKIINIPNDTTDLMLYSISFK